MIQGRSLATAFTATLVAFVVLDAAWLVQVGKPLFQARIGAILRPEPLLGAAIAFYVIYTLGLFVLAVRPALEAQTVVRAAFLGAVLGLTAFATFDLTNLAVIEGWTIDLAAIDIAWGMLASALAAIAGYVAGARTLIRT